MRPVLNPYATIAHILFLAGRRCFSCCTLRRPDNMALSADEMELVLREIRPVLLGGRIQKIHQPGERVLVFEFRVPGETQRLLISCEPEIARLHLLFRSLENPPRPPSFCQFLRAQFHGGRLDDIRQVEHDRIVTLTVSTVHGPRTIVCELTGQTANLLILNERREVLRDLNRQRSLVGHPYAAPSRRTASIQRTGPRFTPNIATDRFPISRAIEAHYHDAARDAGIARARHERLRAIRKTLVKVHRRIKAWREDLAKAASYRDYARYGELLKANLRTMSAGMKHVTLVDYYDASLPEVTLPLDPAKSALQNMNDYFKKHRKYLTAERELQPRIARAEQDAESLRREITAIDEGTWTPPLPPDSPPAQRKTVLPRSSPQTRRGPFRRFVSADGLPVFVGRNAKENEELTFRLAKSDDLWFHARGAPGSHVIVRLTKGADPPPETLRDAATLALLYSDFKNSGKGDVIYTRRKWVKKAKGQSAGAVIVTREKTMAVKLDPQRLAALKERSQ
jgi:predicted ribosome quality control (RQC) complex YloA/Tae2 family protein